MLFSRYQSANSVNRNLSELDQSIQKELGDLLDCSVGTAARKYHARVILENLVDFIFGKHVVEDEFDKLMEKRRAQNDRHRKGDKTVKWEKAYDRKIFLGRAEYLVEFLVIPRYYQNAIAFIWNEGSAYGAHTRPDSDGGLVENVDSIILCIKPLLEWYYYNYRHFNRSDLLVEKMFSEYFDSGFCSLNRKSHKFTIALIGSLPILLALSIVLAVNLHKYNSLYQQQLDVNRLAKSDCMSAMQALKDSIAKSIVATDNPKTNTISNNSVSGDIVTGTKKIENKTIKYNTEKGNVYTLPNGNVTINK